MTCIKFFCCLKIAVNKNNTGANSSLKIDGELCIVNIRSSCAQHGMQPRYKCWRYSPCSASHFSSKIFKQVRQSHEYPVGHDLAHQAVMQLTYLTSRLRAFPFSIQPAHHETQQTVSDTSSAITFIKQYFNTRQTQRYHFWCAMYDASASAE